MRKQDSSVMEDSDYGDNTLVVTAHLPEIYQMLFFFNVRNTSNIPETFRPFHTKTCF